MFSEMHLLSSRSTLFLNFISVASRYSLHVARTIFPFLFTFVYLEARCSMRYFVMTILHAVLAAVLASEYRCVVYKLWDGKPTAIILSSLDRG